MTGRSRFAGLVDMGSKVVRERLRPSPISVRAGRIFEFSSAGDHGNFSRMSDGAPGSTGLAKENSVPAEELLPIVYAELRRLAAAKMAADRPGQTLQPTALVHEAWLRLAADGPSSWQTTNHFLAAAGEAMRRILVERARGRMRLKRGGDWQRIEFQDHEIAAPQADERLVVIHEALGDLERADPHLAQIVTLRFFGGLGFEEIAALLDLNEKTIRRQLTIAKVRLFRLMHSRD